MTIAKDEFLRMWGQNHMITAARMEPLLEMLEARDADAGLPERPRRWEDMALVDDTGEPRWYDNDVDDINDYEGVIR